MGAYTCQYGVVHKTCRCPTPHTIVCDKPLEHNRVPEVEPTHPPEHVCLVMEMRLDGRLPAFGKHEAHPPHDWWYTSYGGGHQLHDDFVPDNGTWDSREKNVKQWHCPGRD